ncbi:MAG: PDZ domain-containing protein [Verrucomicrobiaceae bacterium]|nr:MAG: PDZ domain-containing protein [Verrucomicrobiaceae bacterium]
MKTKSFQLLTAGLAAIATPAFALEAPADLAPPPPQVKRPAVRIPQFDRPADTTTEAAQAQAAVQKAAAPFLGVISGEVPDMVADHIGLEAGQGVIVRSVVPDGPAAASGVELNDVIVKVGGNAIGSPEQLSKEIGTRKPGDSVTLDLIHKGKPSTLEVKLGTRPAEFAAAELAPGGQLDLEGMPKELADSVREAIARDIKGMDIKPGADLGQLPLEMKNAIEEMQKRMEGAVDLPPLPPQAGAPAVQNESTIRMRDNEGSVEVKSKNGAKEVTVRDHQDHVMWSGPWDTAQDQQAAPGSIRQRIDNLNLDTDYKGPGMRLRMGRQGIQDDGQE